MLEHARLCASGSAALHIVFDDASSQPIHPLWLRERCDDSREIDALTGQRLYNPSELDPEIGIASITQPEPGAFTIRFTDDRVGHFSEAGILAELPKAEDAGLPAPAAWCAGDAAPAAFDWRGCDEPATEQAVLESLLIHGYAILHHVPTTHGAVLEVARRFGFPRDTNFGLMFDVRSVPAASDLAYTALKLDPHTDNPYRMPVPGIQLLHCLVNETPGGLSTLVDGLAVAQAIQAESPAAFASLASTRVRFRYEDATTDLVSAAPLIECDGAGRFIAINYSPRLDFVPLLPPDDLAVFFSARRRLDRMLRSPEFERRFRLADGELMMFDNRRLLHGRTAFDPQDGLRHLQGCYIDLDAPRSRARVLRRRRP